MNDVDLGYSDEEWEKRLRAAVAETLRKRQQRRAERAEFKRRRDHGLAARHSAKLARTRNPLRTNESEENR